MVGHMQPPHKAHTVCPGWILAPHAQSLPSPPSSKRVKSRPSPAHGHSSTSHGPQHLLPRAAPWEFAFIPRPCSVSPTPSHNVSALMVPLHRGSLTRIPMCCFLVQHGAHMDTLMHILCAHGCTRGHSQCIPGALTAHHCCFLLPVLCYSQLPGSLKSFVHFQKCLSLKHKCAVKAGCCLPAHALALAPRTVPGP